MTETQKVVLALSFILTIALGLAMMVFVLSYEHVKRDGDGKQCQTKECKDGYNFVYDKKHERYSGWQMGCNYTRGSDSDHQYFLDCANGTVYEALTISESVGYSNQNKPNKFCKEDELDIYYASGEFKECWNW